MEPKLQSIKDKLLPFDTELTEKGFKIYGRSDVTTAILLAYCSPLRFYFQGLELPRGWLDILILGDTRCGKSAIAQNIVSGIRLGEFFTCENVSFAGLIGGLTQSGKGSKWEICWGKVPLNSGKLLIADEMSSLSLEAIGNMSGVRSSGIAEIAKVQGGLTRACTRMVWISNPRSDLSMGAYPQPVRAIPELIGRPEDIARFDFAIGLRSQDVPLSVINSQPEVDPTYSPMWTELNTLVKWVWNLKPIDVVFEPKAVDATLMWASAMASKYHASIPLVEPNEQRIKIARVSAAVAARCFSEMGGKLVVKREHVDFAYWFMQKCLDSPGIAYQTYSATMKSSAEDQTKNTANVYEVMKNMAAGVQHVRSLQYMESFTPTDIEHVFDVPRAESRSLISTMLRAGCLVKTARGYHKTPQGVEIIASILEMMEKIG